MLIEVLISHLISRIKCFNNEESILHTRDSQHRNSRSLTLSNDPNFNIIFGMLPYYNDEKLETYEGPELDNRLPDLLSSNYGEVSSQIQDSRVEFNQELEPEVGNESLNISFGLNQSFSRAFEMTPEPQARAHADSSFPNPSTPIRKRPSDPTSETIRNPPRILKPRPIKEDVSTTLTTAFINTREATYVDRCKTLVRRSVSAQLTLEASKLIWQSVGKPPQNLPNNRVQNSPPSIEIERRRTSTVSQSRRSIFGSEMSLKLATPDSRRSMTPSRRRISTTAYQDENYDYNMDDINIDTDMDFNTELELSDAYHPFLLLGFLPPATSKITITVNQLAELANQAQAKVVSQRSALASTFLHVMTLAQQGKVELSQSRIQPGTEIFVRQL